MLVALLKDSIFKPSCLRFLIWKGLHRIHVGPCYGRAVTTGSTLLPNSQSKPDGATSSYKVAYRFRYIVAAQVLSRLKLYQTFVTLTAVPTVHYMNAIGQADVNTLLFVYGVAGVATAMLYIMSGYFRNLIGLISVNPDSGMVKIAHLTFWGRRQDFVVHMGDIVPLGDLSELPNDVYLKFRTYSSPRSLYYSLRFGQILDRQLLQLVLGRLDNTYNNQVTVNKSEKPQ